MNYCFAQRLLLHGSDSLNKLKFLGRIFLLPQLCLYDNPRASFTRSEIAGVAGTTIASSSCPFIYSDAVLVLSWFK